MSVVDSAPSSTDHPAHVRITAGKDAQQQSFHHPAGQPGRGASASKPTQRGGNSFSQQLLKLARISPTKRQQHAAAAGCQNLPPSSHQGSITPCSSSESGYSSSRLVTPLQTAPSGPDVCSDIMIDVSSCCNSSGGGVGCAAVGGQCAPLDVPANTPFATTAPPPDSGSSRSRPAASSSKGKLLQCRTTSRLLTACAVQADRLRLLSSALKPSLSPAASREQAQANRSPCGLQRVNTTKLPLLPPKAAKGCRQRGASLQPLGSGMQQQQSRKQLPKAASFQATGRENIRVLLGPNAVCGSITRYKMLMMAEQVHEAHLQTVLNQSMEQTDWAGDPAWEEDFSQINNRYAQRVQAFLFWWGGALAHLKLQAQQEEEQEQQHEQEQEAECGSPEAGARVALVLPGESGKGHGGAGDAAFGGAAALQKQRGSASAGGGVQSAST